MRHAYASNMTTAHDIPPGDYADALAVTTNYLNETLKTVSGFTTSYHIHQRVILEAKRLAVSFLPLLQKGQRSGVHRIQTKNAYRGDVKTFPMIPSRFSGPLTPSESP